MACSPSSDGPVDFRRVRLVVGQAGEGEEAERGGDGESEEGSVHGGLDRATFGGKQTILIVWGMRVWVSRPSARTWSAI